MSEPEYQYRESSYLPDAIADAKAQRAAFVAHPLRDFVSATFTVDGNTYAIHPGNTGACPICDALDAAPYPPSD